MVNGPAGSRLWLNETPMGSLPAKEIRAEEGFYVVRVERDGLKPWSQTVAVAGMKTAEVVAMLEAASPVVEVSTRGPGVELGGSGQGKLGQVTWTVGTAVAAASLAVAVTGAVVWIQQKRGSYGTFDSGATGPGLLVGGIVGMLGGGALMYWSKPAAVEGNAHGVTVAGQF